MNLCLTFMTIDRARSTLLITVADIDDTEVIWIALLRHAGKNTGST